MTLFKKVIFYFLLPVFAVNILGCSAAKHANELLTLRSLAASQDAIEKSVILSRKHFSKMLEDYKKGSLKKGLRKRYIISQYGQPVLIKLGEVEGVNETFIYRDPLKYLSSDILYLYFDKKNKLISLKYEPKE